MKNRFKIFNYSIICLFFVFIFLIFYFYIKFSSTFIIKNEDDIINVLENIDSLPYEEQDIYEIDFTNNKIYVLYRNKRFDEHFIFRVFEKDYLFKDRYRNFYAKDNNFLDSKLNCETFKTKTYSLGFIYGINLTNENYNTIVENNVYSGEYTIHNFNNISGNFVQTIKSDKHSDFILYSFSSQEEQSEFINELSNRNR